MQSISETAWGTPGQMADFGNHFNTILIIQWQHEY